MDDRDVAQLRFGVLQNADHGLILGLKTQGKYNDTKGLANSHVSSTAKVVHGFQFLRNVNTGLCIQANVSTATEFKTAERAHTSMLASLEKKALVWLAHRIPAPVNSDHLTILGFVSLIGVGLGYWYSRYSPVGLLLVIGFFVLNWFGDSLDGTLARVRDQQRPRYGFYVDHILDACGSVFVFGGLALSGFMSERIAVGLLVVYFLLSIEVYLATYTVGKFHLSFGFFGPTELRLLLIAGNIALLSKPVVKLAGKQYLLFDVGGAIGIVGIGIALLFSIVKHTTLLYRAERLS